MSNLNLQLIEVPNVSVEEVHFDVEVDRSRCPFVPQDIEQRLHELEVGGMRISINALVFACAAYFEGGPVHPAQAANAARVYENQALSLIAQYNPRAVTHPKTGRSKMVLNASGNPRTQSNVTEVLAVGIGLHVAAQVYAIPDVFWSGTGLSDHDFEATKSDGSLYKLEVRGRFRHQNWKQAKEDMDRKFAQGDFSNAMGVLFAPTDTPDTRVPEITIMDPTGTVKNTSASQLHGILRHYLRFFKAQNMPEFVRRLEELSQADEQSFEAYLCCGDDILRAAGRQARLNLTAFCFGGATFIGTAWDNVAWPRAVTGMEAPSETGCYYWAIWDKVLEALQNGHLADIATMTVKQQTSRVGNMVFILMEDAMAFAWAPTEAELTPSLFDNQPVGAEAGSNA